MLGGFPKVIPDGRFYDAAISHLIHRKPCSNCLGHAINKWYIHPISCIKWLRISINYKAGRPDTGCFGAYGA